MSTDCTVSSLLRIKLRLVTSIQKKGGIAGNEIMGDLKSAICQELFQDPRSLHTFCRECIQRSALNKENHSLECPVCCAKHDSNYKRQGGGGYCLHVTQYALQELPLKRLQQQREDNGGHQVVECKSCGEQAGPVVAWCGDCDAMICQQCLSQHEKMSILRGHVIKSIKKFGRSASESIAETNAPINVTPHPPPPPQYGTGVGVVRDYTTKFCPRVGHLTNSGYAWIS